MANRALVMKNEEILVFFFVSSPDPDKSACGFKSAKEALLFKSIIITIYISLYLYFLWKIIGTMCFGSI